MPIDARIPLGVNPINIRPRADTLMDVMRLREAQDTMQDRSVQRAETQRKLKEEADIREAIAATGGDLEKALPRIQQISPTYGIAVQNTLDDQATKKRQAATAKLEQNQKLLEHDSQLLNSAVDQTTYDAALGRINEVHKQIGLPPVAYPPTYDAKVVDGLRNQALSVKEKLDLEQRRLTAGIGNTDYGRALRLWMRDNNVDADTLTSAQEEAFREEYRKKQNPGGVTKTDADLYLPKTDDERDLMVSYRRVNPDAKTLLDVPDDFRDAFKAKQAASKTPRAASGITPTLRKDAEQWKQKQLADLEEKYRKSVIDQHPLTDDQLRASKLEIENSYRTQVGGRPADAYPKEYLRKEAAAVLAQYKAEADPIKKEQYKKRLDVLHTQLTGTP